MSKQKKYLLFSIFSVCLIMGSTIFVGIPTFSEITLKCSELPNRLIIQMIFLP